MAADNRRKRINGNSITGCSSWEQYKSKKKKLESPKNELNANSHISLEWDGNRKKVVAKREQIGISQKDLKAFDPAVQRHNVLADVISIPQELFEVKNLKEVLSYEVWTHLSENERKYLKQFLPKGSDAEKVVHALLSGDNFHFGNPFLKWGSSLCSGNLHPDAVIHQERSIKADKKTYYSEIQNYHNDMIKYLQKLKEIWESSKDPEKEVLLKISRSRRDADIRIPSHANESRFYDCEENAVATSESCSLVAEEKACSSDNQNSSVMKGREPQRRVHEKGFMKDKSKKPLVALDDARPRKGEKIEKHNIHQTDGDKYMSYLKISKKQHQLVKSMKHSGQSIQSRSLHRVLGDLDTLHVQPYEEFVKEEQKKLHKYWLQIANEDLPVAYENWRQRQFQRQDIIKSLGQDVKDKVEHWMEEEAVNHDIILKDQNNEDDDQGGRSHESISEDEEKLNNKVHLDQNIEGARSYDSDTEDEEKFDDETIVQDQNDQGESEHEFSEEDEEKFDDETIVQDQNDQGESEHEFSEDVEKEVMLEDQNGTRSEASFEEDDDVSGSSSRSQHFQSHQQISSHSGDRGLNPVDVDSESNHVASKSDDVSPNALEYSGNADAADPSISREATISAGGDVWPADTMPQSFYDSTTNHDFATGSKLSLQHPVNEAQRPQLIDLESDVHEEDTRKNLFHRQSDDGSLSSFPNHDRSGLLQSLFKGQEMLSYPREQRSMGLDFQSPNNVLIEDGHFTGHLQRQLQPSLLVQAQKRHGDNYIQQSMSDGIYSEGSAYLMPRQGHVPPVNLQDWSVRMSSRPQPQPQPQPQLNNDVLLTHNWYSGEHQVRSGWNNTDNVSVPNQNIGNNTDQSLFSVLSQCNQLRSSNHFDAVGGTEQFMLPRNYEMASGVASRISGSLPQPGHPLDYLSGRDGHGANSLMSDDGGGWMSLPQNSGLNDPVGKSYLRSWNQ